MSFAQVFDGEPDVVWRAPGRVNLIGEHTDYNDGFVLPWALPLGVTAALRRNNSGVLRMVSRQHGGADGGLVQARVADLAPGSVEGWAGYPAGVVWRLREAGLLPDAAGFDVLVDGDVPAGAGLSSSAALECVVVRAVDDVLGLGLSGPEAAAHARGAENEFVGVPSGVMDQMASLMCAEGSALFLDTRSMATRQVPLDVAGAGLVLLLVDTNAPHTLVDGAYADRQRACAAGAGALGVAALRDVTLAGLDEALARLDDDVVRRRVRHVVTENARVLDVVGLLDDGRPDEIGPLLTASHASLRDDFEVTVPELDVCVDAALAAGALGARMTGGGFGGSVVILARAAEGETITDAVGAEFAAHGFAPPRLVPATPSAGAHRLDGPHD